MGISVALYTLDTRIHQDQKYTVLNFIRWQNCCCYV